MDMIHEEGDLKAIWGHGCCNIGMMSLALRSFSLNDSHDADPNRPSRPS